MPQVLHVKPTREDVATALDDAYATVVEAELPPEWRLQAFLRAVDLFAGQRVIVADPPPFGAPTLPGLLAR